MSRQPREAAVGLKAFHYFPRLPMELQFDILELAAQQSRIVRMDISGKYPDRDRGLTVIMDGKRREQVPPLLVTSHLTRHVALKIGIICVTIVDMLDPTRDARHFALFRHDIIFFSGGATAEEYRALHGMGETDKIQNIMVGTNVRRLLTSYGSIDATAHSLLRKSEALIRGLGCQLSLENIYCMIHNSRSSSLRKFTMEDLVSFSPDEFPRYRDDVAEFLRGFDQELEQPQTVNIRPMVNLNRDNLLKLSLLCRKKLTA